MSTGPESPFRIISSREFSRLLIDNRLSIAFSTYQTGKLFFLGVKEGGGLSAFERTFDRCMGLWTDSQSLWLASSFQIWKLQNSLGAGERANGFDRLFVPRIGYVTGDIDVHDIAIDGAGRVVFVSTLFSCLATVSETLNFEPLWRPPFISKLAAEDRCHLNGLAMLNGRAGYATLCARCDVVDGWRDLRSDGGCVYDIESNELVLDGLSMPHSPRIYRDRLWLLDSGHGQFGYVDTERGKFEPVAFCPGYARGLSFFEKYAVIGLSAPRHEPTFAGLPLDNELKKRNATPRCGLMIVDLDTGDTVQWVRIEGAAQELYDVVVLPDVVRPKALGFKTTEIRHNVWTRDDGRAMHWIANPKD